MKSSSAPPRPRPKAIALDTRAVVLLLVVCLGLGLLGIRWGLPDAKHPHYSFHPDETPGLTSALSIITDPRPLFPTQWAYEQSPFFFYFASVVLRVASWTQLAPIHKEFSFADYVRQLLAGRLLVLVAFCGVVLLTYLVFSRMWGLTTGLLTALLTAVSPVVATNAHYFKNDVPLLFFVLVTLLFSLRIYESGRAREYVWAGVFCGIATATKWHGFTAGLFIIMAHFLRAGRQPGRVRAHRRLLLSLACFTAAFLVAVPGIFLHPDVVRAGVMRELERRIGQKTGFMLVMAKTNPGPLALMSYALGALPFLASIASLVYLVVRKRDTFLFLILPFTILLLLVFGVLKAAFVRYLVPLAPFLMAMVARATYDVVRRRGFLRIVAIVSVAATGIYALLSSLSYVTPMSRRDPRTLATDWLTQNVPEHSRLTVETFQGENFEFVDSTRYSLNRIWESRVGDNRDTAMLSWTDFYVANEAVYRRYLKERDDLPRQGLFYQRLLNNGEFTQVADFDARPELFGWKLPKGYPPDDLMLFLPQIRILRRIR